jgi:uncharacterized membrane protein affecting hemolysin expression
MSMQNIKENKAKWDKIVNNADIFHRTIYNIPGVNIAEAEQNINQAIHTLKAQIKGKWMQGNQRQRIDQHEQ